MKWRAACATEDFHQLRPGHDRSPLSCKVKSLVRRRLLSDGSVACGGQAAAAGDEKGARDAANSYFSSPIFLFVKLL